MKFSLDADLYCVLSSAGAKQHQLYEWRELIVLLLRYMFQQRPPLIDPDDESRVHCGANPLGRVFGVTQFTRKQTESLLVPHLFCYDNERRVLLTPRCKRHALITASNNDVTASNNDVTASNDDITPVDNQPAAVNCHTDGACEMNVQRADSGISVTSTCDPPTTIHSAVQHHDHNNLQNSSSTSTISPTTATAEHHTPSSLSNCPASSNTTTAVAGDDNDDADDDNDDSAAFIDELQPADLSLSDCSASSAATESFDVRNGRVSSHWPSSAAVAVTETDLWSDNASTAASVEADVDTDTGVASTRPRCVATDDRSSQASALSDGALSSRNGNAFHQRRLLTRRQRDRRRCRRSLPDPAAPLDASVSPAVRPAAACVVCCDRPPLAAIVHGVDACVVCCYECARWLWTRRHRCPVCRRRIRQVTHVKYG